MTPENVRKLILVGSTLADEYTLSCGREPTLHSRFQEIVESLPEAGNAVLTTNLARRLGWDTLMALARSRLKRIQVSVETLEPVRYEGYRSGATYEHFTKNLWGLKASLREAPDPKPTLTSITLLFKSNANPKRLGWLLDDLRSFGFSDHEIRVPFPFTEGYMSAATRADLLTQAEYADLAANLQARYPGLRVNGLPWPDSTAAPAPGQPRPALVFVSANGRVLWPDGSTGDLNEMADPVAAFSAKLKG